MDSALAFLIVLSLLAASLEFACLRDPGVPDNQMSLICRRLGIAGWLFFSARFFYLIWVNESVHWLSVLGFSFIALSSIIRCANRLNMIHNRGHHDYL